MLVKLADSEEKKKQARPNYEIHEGNAFDTGLLSGGYSTQYDDGEQKFIITKMPLNFANKLLSPVHSIFHSDTVSKDIADTAEKHEIDEALYGSKHPHSMEGFVRSGGFKKSGLFSDHTGAHYSLALLGKEANNILQLDPKSKEWFTKLRHFTGERKLLHDITGKVYGYDKFTEKDLEKLEKKKPDQLQHIPNQFGEGYQIGWHSTKAPGPNLAITSAIGSTLGLGVGAYSLLKDNELGRLIEKNPIAVAGLLMLGGSIAAGITAGVAHAPARAFWKSSPNDFKGARK